MSSDRLATLLVHAGARHVDGAVISPIYPSAHYLQGSGDGEEVIYQRYSNTPQHEALHDKLAVLEGSERALVVSSGMAAVSAALLSVLSAGDHLLVQRNTYGGTTSLVGTQLKRLGISHTEVDAARPETWAAACTLATRAFYVESLSNPLLEVPQLDAVVGFCNDRGLVSVIDNTLLSPAGFRPVPFGFDLVVHSATKYLNGHGDLIAGVVAGSAARMAEVVRVSRVLGPSLDSHALYLLDRGLKTLLLRMQRQTDNALRLAIFLADHPAVTRVRYPGSPGDPGHERAKAFFEHFGAMITFEVADAAAAERFLGGVRVALHAASLGGVESLVVQPSRSSHATVSAEQRRALGITDAMVRVSVGIEDSDDLVEDFANALAG
jgi:cystathionine beta-lyase/cystathionine gamma-synthase